MYFYTLFISFSFTNFLLAILQGFSLQNLTPNEAAAILFRCEQRLGHAIPEEDLVAGKLGQYLRPEDYKPIKDVSNSLFTFLC